MHPTDVDPQETREWLDALDAVVANDGVQRAQQLVESVIDRARRVGAPPPDQGPTPYVNTIPPQLQAPFSGDLELEHRIRSAIRWNAIAMVMQANKESSELGGHIASFQSAATLYEVGFNHFWHAPSDTHGGDLVFIQGHSSPGIYARAFLEGRLSEEQMKRFRQELDEKGRFDGKGLSSYPHPWLMPQFWSFPTVSMGLAPIMATTRPATIATSRIAGSRSRAAACGPSWATARRTSPSRSAPSPSRPASGSTTSSSSSTATCRGSTGRCAATGRSSRSSRPCSAAPAGTSSR